MECKKDNLDFCHKALHFNFEADDKINQLNHVVLCIYNEYKGYISKDRI